MRLSKNGFVFSQKISALPKTGIGQKQIIVDAESYPFVLPRVFPHPTIPLKVSINRKVKQFNAFDINEPLKGIDWSLGNNELSLTHYVFSSDYVFEYGCTEENITNHKVMGRAYNQQLKKYEPFEVTSRQEDYFTGKFKKNIAQQEFKLHRSMICFDFQDPLSYVGHVLQAQKRRQKVIDMIKYEFFVDNIDLEDAPLPHKHTFIRIKELINGGRNQLTLSLSQINLVLNHYKRTMNEIMFRYLVRMESIDVYIPAKYGSSKNRKKVKFHRELKIKKDNKIIVLKLKPIGQKIKDLEFKTLVITDSLSSVIMSLKRKIADDFHVIRLFDEGRERIVEKFIVDQERSIFYCFSAFNEYIIDPISSEIRAELQEKPLGWFRMYETDRSTYLSSKLKRLFIMINNMLRDAMQDKLADEFDRFLRFLQKNTPEKVEIEGINRAKVKFFKNIAFSEIISIELVIDKGSIKLSHGSEKVRKILKKLISAGLDKFRTIPSPEPIVLRQIYGGYKNQEGIKLELPDLENIELYQYMPILRETIKKINLAIDQLCKILEDYERQLKQFSGASISALLLDTREPSYTVEELIKQFHYLTSMEQKLTVQLSGSNIKLGFFTIDYKWVKSQIFNNLKNNKEGLRRQLLYENKKSMQKFRIKINKLDEQLRAKPKNVYELIEKQNKIKNFDTTLQSISYSEWTQLQNLCESFECKLDPGDWATSMQNHLVIHKIRLNIETIENEFDSFKKDEIKVIQAEIIDLHENMRLVQITKDNMKNEKDPSKCSQLSEKSKYLKSRIAQLKATATTLLEKKRLLNLDSSEDKQKEQIQMLESQFEPYALLWMSAEQWMNLSVVWLNQPIGSFKIHNPETILRNLQNNFKKSSQAFSKRNEQELMKIAKDYFDQITDFEPKLRLLRLLKKEGLTRKHLQQIGIEIETEISNLSLAEALKAGFLQKISQIQVISNDAWNQFSLEQTLQRVNTEIERLRFVVSSYKDRKNNDIYIIINYEELIAEIDSILINLESVQFNSMKAIFESAIKVLYEKTQYISNSIEICYRFQQIFVELHPIFDSTDIAKQIPAENKKFDKFLRVWLELMNYIRKILSVNDVCSAQNVYQKVKSILNSIEGVKKELISYLEQKRKGFSRFYLLSNSEMFEIFSATSDISAINSLIPKLFQSVSSIRIQTESSLITGICSDKNESMTLKTPIYYKGVNLQNWLNSLEKQIRSTIIKSVLDLILEFKGDWVNIIRQGTWVVQIIYLVFEIETVENMRKEITAISRVVESNRSILNTLVQSRREAVRSSKEQIVICSLIILAISNVETAERLRHLNVCSIDNFEWKKIMKPKYYPQNEENSNRVLIEVLNFEKEYGCDYLGVYSRLVITSLTERMQLVYMLAQKYSLGCAAIGPAGTGKSETTKEIARINGKTCLVYNCSQEFEISTFSRLLKGLAITGLWMCFDEFNRLNFQIFNAISDELSFLLKFRRFNHRMEVHFTGDLIWLDPQFQICITYNPTYAGRQRIPKQVHELFRNVALVKPDELAICKSLLYSSGFSQGQVLGKKLSAVFEICRNIWRKQKLYDFGLRALRSVIELSTKYLFDEKKDEQRSIIESMKALNALKLKSHDKLLFIDILDREFGSTSALSFEEKEAEEQKQDDFLQILKIRNGALLLGQPLSGKQTIIKQFQKKHPDQNVLTIFHDVLTTDELFGKLDSTTKLWKDGYFTKIVRQSLSQNANRQKMLIVFNGSLYPEWTQNLNSVLDSTRKLSLSSGQSLAIPQSLKISVLCTDLGRSTPATITRFGVIFNQSSEYKQVALSLNKNFPQKILDFYEDLESELKDQFQVKIQKRFIIYWVVFSIGSQAINYDNFIYQLTLVYEGILTAKGRAIYQQFCRSYLSKPLSPFEILLNSKCQAIQLKHEFSKFKNFENANKQFVDTEFSSFQAVFVPTERSFKCHQIMDIFSKGQSDHKKLLVFFGEANIGKTKIASSFYDRLPNQSNEKGQIFFTRRSSGKELFESIRVLMTKKTSTKLGAKPGSRVNLWIEDLNLPMENKYAINETGQLLRLIISSGEWYNYEQVMKESLEDIVFMADAHFSRSQSSIGLSKRLYKHMLPVFLSGTNADEIFYIFKGIVENSKPSRLEDEINQTIWKGIQVYYYLKSNECGTGTAATFTLMELYRSLKGFLEWPLSQNCDQLEKIYLFELSRTLGSKTLNLGLSNFKRAVGMTFLDYKQTDSLPIFHNLERSCLATEKCEQVVNLQDFTNRIQCICDEYIKLTKSSNSIIVFPQMIQYLIKVYRTLQSDYNHAAIVGLSKSGKKTIIKLASYIISSELYLVKDSFDDKDWHESLKMATKGSYKSKNSSLLLIEHRQITSPLRMLEINKLLNTMHLPNIYSQADIEEMIYMIQIELVKKDKEVNKENMWIEFLAFLQKKMHVVLSLNPAFTSFTEFISLYPSIEKYCTFFFLSEWPREALNLIAELEMSDLGFPLKFLPLIHEYSSEICKGAASVLNSTWEGMYFSFVAFTRKIYEKNHSLLLARKRQYLKSQQVIEETQRRLEETKNKIKKLQPAIILIESQTSKTVKNLNIQRKNAQQANLNLQAKNEETEKIIQQSQALKHEFEEKVKGVELQLEKVWETVSLLKPNHISEVKALANPSDFIKTVLAALVILTHDGPLVKEVKEKDGHMTVQESYFETAKKNVLSKDAKSICRLLIEFKRENVTAAMFAKLEQKCLSDKRWVEKEARSANRAIYYFFLWVEAVVSQYRIYEETQPIRDELERITSILHTKQIQIAAIKKELELYRVKIEQLEDLHASKKSALQEYRIQIAKFERMLSRGYDLLRQIESEKVKWNRYIEDIDQRMRDNFGNSVLMASTIIYTSPHVYETRMKINAYIKQLCLANAVTYCKGTHPWYLTRQQMQTIHNLQISDKIFMIDNIKVIENSESTVLLLDPEEQGIKLIKQLNWQNLQSPVDKISEFSSHIRKEIQSAVLYGRIVLIDVDPSSFNPSLRFAINPTVINNELQSLDKRIPIHPNYRLYLYSTCYTNKKCSMELLTSVQTINFKMTEEQLKERIMETFILIQMPWLKNKIEDIFKVNTKDLSNLNAIEEKLLSMFSEQLSVQEILENDEIINTVVHSNRLYRQIQSRIKQSKLQQEQIEVEKKPYAEKVKTICSIYVNMSRLKMVSPLYAYSYQWYIELFERNISNFHLTLYKQISKALKKEEKIIVAILIAQVLHPNLPWDMLFNAELEESSKSQPVEDPLQMIFGHIGALVNQLPVSQKRWQKIVSRVKMLKNHIPNLESNLMNNCSQFIPMIEIADEQILESIPDQYSSLSFFNRILIVSCFRPECVMDLVREWIKINIGFGFVEANLSYGTLITNTCPYRPVIAILDDTSEDPIQKIKEVYKQANKGEQISTPVISVHWSSSLAEDFESTVKALIAQNQWLVIEGVNSEQSMTFIKEVFEDLTVLPQKIFRCWVIFSGQADKYSQRFCQFCDKVRIISNRNLYKEISDSFYWQYESVSKKQMDYFERNKTKLMISQLSILHNLLREFNYFNRLSNEHSSLVNSKKTVAKEEVFSMTDRDLQLIIEEISEYPIEERTKTILSQELIKNLSYGSQVGSYHLERFLMSNASEIVSDIVTDRNTFWQTIWCDQKFPRDPLQYEHEIKNHCIRKHYLQNFNLDSSLIKSLKAKSYETICKFYRSTIYQEEKGIMTVLRRKLENLQDELNNLAIEKIRELFEKRLHEIKKITAPQYQLFFHFFRMEAETNIQLYNQYSREIKRSLELITKFEQIIPGSKQEKFNMDIFWDLTPAAWTPSQASIHPQAFCFDFISNIRSLAAYMQQFMEVQQPLNCGIINHVELFLHCLYRKFKVDQIESRKAEIYLIPFRAEKDKQSIVDILKKLKLVEEVGVELFEDKEGNEKPLQQAANKNKEILGYQVVSNLLLWGARLNYSNCKGFIRASDNFQEQQATAPVMPANKSALSNSLISSILKPNLVPKVKLAKTSGADENIEQKVHGLLLFCQKDTKLCVFQKSDSLKVIEIPLYEYSVQDLGEEGSPMGIVKMYCDYRMSPIEIARHNAHLSFKK